MESIEGGTWAAECILALAIGKIVASNRLLGEGAFVVDKESGM